MDNFYRKKEGLEGVETKQRIIATRIINIWKSQIVSQLNKKSLGNDSNLVFLRTDNSSIRRIYFR